MRAAKLVLVLTACWMSMGCQNGSTVLGEPAWRFRSCRLGQVDPTETFGAAQSVLADYFTIASANPATGVIICEPKTTADPANRTFTSTAVRELAVLRIRQEATVVWADVRVAVQRQQTGNFTGFSPPGYRSEVPNQTPALEDAPLTQEQKASWRSAGYNLDTERRILMDLQARIKPAQ